MNRNFSTANVKTLLLATTSLMLANAARAETVTLSMSVGVNTSFDSNLQSLLYAETDAERMHNTQLRVGEVHADNAVLLVSPTANEFVQTVATRTRELRSAGKNVRLNLYFSGHADDHGLHFRDAPLSRMSLHDLLAATDTQTRVVILDSCFSGAIATKGAERTEGFEVPRLDVDELTGTVFLTATTSRDMAYESRELSGSVFTHYLVAGLNGAADSDQDGIVTVDELYRYGYRQTKLRSGGYPGPATQTPEFHGDLKGSGALVMSRPRQEMGTLRIDPGIIGAVYLLPVDGAGGFYTVYGDTRNIRDFQIPKGVYRATIRRGNLLGEASVTIIRKEARLLQPSSFSWRETSMQLASNSKGIERQNSSRLQMVDFRHTGSGADLKGYGYEYGRELTNLSGSQTRAAIVGLGRIDGANGTISDHSYSSIGASAALGLLVQVSGVPMRGTFGLGVGHEWQTWKTQSESDARVAADEKRPRDNSKERRDRWTPEGYVGVLLPMTSSRASRLSLAIRKVSKWQINYDDKPLLLDQYLFGLIFE